MTTLINSGRFRSGESITLLSTGSNKCLMILPISRTSVGQSALTVTVGSTNATIHDDLYAANGSSSGQAGIAYILDANYPAAGAHVVTFSWLDGMVNDEAVFVEFNDVSQLNPFGALAVTQTLDSLSTVTTSTTLTNSAGTLALVVGMFTGSSFSNPSGFINSTDALTSVVDSMSNAVNSNSRIHVFQDAPATNSETYGIDYSLRGIEGQQVDTMFTVALAVNDFVAATLSADSITAGTIRAGDTVTIQLSNATNASGKTLSIPQGALTPTAQDINSISFTAPDLKTFGDKTGDYSTNITITVTDGLESDTIDFQIAPDVGYETGTITALEGVWGEAAVLAAPVSIGDYYYAPAISGADWTVGAIPVLETEQTITAQYKDLTDNTWKDGFIFTISGSGVSASALLRNVLTDIIKPIIKSF